MKSVLFALFAFVIASPAFAAPPLMNCVGSEASKDHGYRLDVVIQEEVSAQLHPFTKEPLSSLSIVKILTKNDGARRETIQTQPQSTYQIKHNSTVFMYVEPSRVTTITLETWNPSADGTVRGVFEQTSPGASGTAIGARLDIVCKMK